MINANLDLFEDGSKLDLLSPIPVDSMFRVKVGEAWYPIIVPRIRKKNGKEVLFGELYSYYMKLDNFRMLKGLVLSESYCGKYWEGKTQYFYFTKRQPPIIQFKYYSNPYITPKRKFEL